MTNLKNAVLIFALAYAGALFAQQSHPYVEPLPKDPARENAIVGGELIVLDVRTNEILGVRRGFILSGNVRDVKSGIRWEIGTVFPAYRYNGVFNKRDDFAYWFISKVLGPFRRG